MSEREPGTTPDTTRHEPRIFTPSEMMKEAWMSALIGFGVGAPVWICVGVNLMRLVNGH